jgi:VCBS repeat-containing protein
MSTGPGIINGDVGVYPAGPQGIPLAQVNGTIYNGDAGGIAQQAQADLTTAYTDAAGRSIDRITLADGENLGGQTLAPGLYGSASSLQITGDLTLDAGGDPHAVWIFQMGSTLTTAAGAAGDPLIPNSRVILAGGAQAKNIFWQVGSSATLGTYSVFKGTIMAQASVTMDTASIMDGRALARTAAVTFNGASGSLPNTAPVAVADAGTVSEGGTMTVLTTGPGNTSVLDNDTDAEGDPLTAILVADVTNGALTLNADGTFSYTHDGSETVSDLFTYQANDGIADSNTVTVTITVTPVNDPPVAVPDAGTVAEGGTMTVLTTGPGNTSVLDNDTDAEGDPLTAILVDDVTNGALTLNADGTFSYTHDGSETVSDLFTYQANDSLADSNTVTVTITVTPVNDPPVAVPDAGTVAEGGTMTVLTTGPGNTSVLDNDTDAESDPLTAILVDDVTNGALTLNADGTFSYTHDGSETVSDLFTYQANDGLADSNTVTVTITVTPVNDPPVAVPDAGTVAEGGTMTVLTTGPGNTSVLDNDTDAESDPLTAILVDDVTNGALTLNADGTFSYTHDGSETVSDLFTYQANDGLADSNTVTVIITIVPASQGPVAVNDSVTTPMNTPVTITVLDNDTAADGCTLTVTGVTAPINGTAVVNPDDTILYTPDTDYLGLDAFTYTISDGQGGTDSAMFLVTVGDAAGADDSDMSLAKMACTINWAKHADGIAADTLAISGRFNPRGIMLNLNAATVTITVNGVQLLLPVPLGSKGTAVGNPTYNYRVNWKNGYYSFKVKGLDLRTAIGVTNETATMPRDLTMTVTVADADLDVPLVAGTFACQSVTKTDKTSKLTFKNKSDSTLSGVYQCSSTKVSQKGTVHNLTVKGLIEAEGGGSVIPTGDITVKIGDAILVIPAADLVVKNDDRSYKGVAPGITKFTLQNSKHAFALTAVMVEGTGIPLGNFDAPESYRLQVQIQVPTADGVTVFDSIVEILRPNGNAKAWKR